MTTPDQLIDMLVEVLTSDPAFQDKVRELVVGCIANSNEIVEKIEDIVMSSSCVERFIKGMTDENQFERRTFRTAVQDIIKDMDFTVKVN